MPIKTRLKVIKRKPVPNGQGAPIGNGNALKSGVLADITRNIDGRSLMAKAMRAIEADLVGAIGGEPSPQEMMLIQRAKYKAIKCALFESASLNGEGNCQDEKYLAWANSLRLDLQALGLARRMRKVTDLQSYIAAVGE